MYRDMARNILLELQIIGSLHNVAIILIPSLKRFYTTGELALRNLINLFLFYATFNS